MDKVLNLNISHLDLEDFIPNNVSIDLAVDISSLAGVTTKFLNDSKSLLISFSFKKYPIQNVTVNTNYIIENFTMRQVKNGYILNLSFLKS